jgi:hypothetical protein
MNCPSCQCETRITATIGGTATHVCTRCGQGWKSATKRKTRRVKIDLAATTGEIAFRLADCFGGKIVMLQAITVKGK